MFARTVSIFLLGIIVVVLAMAFWPSEPLRIVPDEASVAPRAGESSVNLERIEPFAAPPDVVPAGSSIASASRETAPRETAPRDTAAPRPMMPACRVVPVLPTVPDVTADSCNNPVSLIDVLEREERDPGWAVDMEARLREAILGAEGLALARLEIECRTTSCGILLVHAEGADSMTEHGIVAERVRDAAGFQQWGGTSQLASADGKMLSTISLMHASGREPLWPAPPAIPALPGLSGVDIPLLGIAAIDDAHPAKLLADEIDDPAWARPTELRITDRIGALAPKNWYQSHVGCRRNTCGIVLLYPPGTDVDVTKVESDFADALGFTARGTGRSYERDLGTLVTIYLHR